VGNHYSPKTGYPISWLIRTRDFRNVKGRGANHMTVTTAVTSAGRSGLQQYRFRNKGTSKPTSYAITLTAHLEHTCTPVENAYIVLFIKVDAAEINSTPNFL
jgi:hypothetical protein